MVMITVTTSRRARGYPLSAVSLSILPWYKQPRMSWTLSRRPYANLVDGKGDQPEMVQKSDVFLCSTQIFTDGPVVHESISINWHSIPV